MANIRYYVEVAPGCHGRVGAPILSSHRSWDAAKRAALKSDRLVAINELTGERFQIPQQNDRRYGSGRLGNGISPAKARGLGLI